NAAVRDATTRRDSTKYHAYPVPNRFRVINARYANAGPKSNVTGVSNTPGSCRPTFAIRFTPSGAFCSVVKKGFDRCVTECAAFASIHSLNEMSPLDELSDAECGWAKP